MSKYGLSGTDADPGKPEPEYEEPEDVVGLCDLAREAYRDAWERDKIGTPARRALLMTALHALDDAERARRTIQAEGATFTNQDSGMIRAHPLVRVGKDAGHLFARIWTDLDMEQNVKMNAEGRWRRV